MDKEQYEIVEMSIITFEHEDIITDSLPDEAISE